MKIAFLTPLKKADERSKTVWSKAYQAVKHDRYNSLYQGNIKALLHSEAALYLLNIYYAASFPQSIDIFYR